MKNSTMGEIHEQAAEAAITAYYGVCSLPLADDNSIEQQATELLASLLVLAEANRQPFDPAKVMAAALEQYRGVQYAY
jgi:hypothetical protein